MVLLGYRAYQLVAGERGVAFNAWDNLTRGHRRTYFACSADASYYSGLLCSSGWGRQRCGTLTETCGAPSRFRAGGFDILARERLYFHAPFFFPWPGALQ